MWCPSPARNGSRSSRNACGGPRTSSTLFSLDAPFRRDLHEVLPLVTLLVLMRYGFDPQSGPLSHRTVPVTSCKSVPSAFITKMSGSAPAPGTVAVVIMVPSGENPARKKDMVDVASVRQCSCFPFGCATHTFRGLPSSMCDWNRIQRPSGDQPGVPPGSHGPRAHATIVGPVDTHGEHREQAGGLVEPLKCQPRAVW